MKNKFKVKKEGQVKKEILKVLKQKFPQGVWYKMHGSLHQERGLPDILGCYNSKFYGLEIKRPGKEKNVTDYQKYQLDRIRESGGHSAVISSAEEAIKFILKNL